MKKVKKSIFLSILVVFFILTISYLKSVSNSTRYVCDEKPPVIEEVHLV